MFQRILSVTGVLCVVTLLSASPSFAVEKPTSLLKNKDNTKFQAHTNLNLNTLNRTRSNTI